jgi:phospholipase/carboxylesterase
MRSPSPSLSRRELLRLGGAGLAACALGCSGGSAGDVAPEPSKGRLGARPGPAGPVHTKTGILPLGLSQERSGILYAPRCRAGFPAPLVLMLHGATSYGARACRILEDLAEETGFLVLCPDSRRITWDAITGRFGPDVEFIDRALAQTFSRYEVDPARIAVAGFSDGATYALALARANGDLFTCGIAFSPGFVIPVTPHGSPRLFFSHGIHDQVLPIGPASRAMVAALRREGYRIEYEEFDGDHEVPPAIARQAVTWYLGASNFPPSRVISGCAST